MGLRLFCLLIAFVTIVVQTYSQERTLVTETVGQFKDLLPDSTCYGIATLKVIGPINEDDLYILQHIAKNHGKEKGTDCRLTTLDLSEAQQLTVIDDFAFAGCTQLAAIHLPASLIRIGHHAFEGCTSLKAITLPSKVEKIGSDLFENCLSLDSVVIQGQIEELPDDVFRYCHALRYVELPNTVKNIGDNAFERTSLRTFSIPTACRSIGSAAFRDCNGLTAVSLPATLKKIGGNAFTRCVSLRTISCGSPTPPQTSHTTFKGVIHAVCKARIPQGAKRNYSNDTSWRRMILIEE